MVKTLTLLTLVGALAGCASTRPEFLENRVVCTVAQEKAFVVSQWGPVGITAEVASADAKVICKSGEGK
jgi:hypothetical protein